MYNLSFISDDQLFSHVKETVLKYRFKINLKEFNKNLIDPIKLTFDASVYGKSLEEIIEGEIIRQIDKSNTNHIGYFHQNIFQYINSQWVVQKNGFDIINFDKKIFVEMKNKHNTMNSSSSQKTYLRMQNKILENSDITCLLVEVIAKKSQNIPWTISLDGKQFSHSNIRRVLIDKFYELVTLEKDSFKNLCEILPTILEDVMQDLNRTKIYNSVFQELNDISEDLLKSLYLLSFKKYEGFGTLKF
jgi:hypothetical protein